MRRLLLLLSCASLAMAACPPMLQVIERDWFYGFDAEIPDAADTACGKKNFTAAFWSIGLYRKMLEFKAMDQIRRNATGCSTECVEELDEKLHGHTFEPLLEKLNEEMQRMDNTEARKYLDSVYAEALEDVPEDLKREHKWAQNMTVGNVVTTLVGGIFGTIGNSLKHIFSRPRLTNEIEISHSRLLKRVFGYVETTEMRQYRIETAMNAFDNTMSGRDDREIAAVIGQLQALSNETTFFQSFTSWMDEHSVWIRPVEVVPAIETLYLQYRTITNADAKKFADLFLASWKRKYEKPQSKRMRRLAEGQQIQPAVGSLEDQFAAAISALTTAFPELFDYLHKHGYIAKKSIDIEGSGVEIEGSGFGPEQF